MPSVGDRRVATNGKAAKERTVNNRSARPSAGAKRSSAARPSSHAVAPTQPALRCPRCAEGMLITGARGWGCSRWRDGCGFVVWFETAGRRLSPAQLRDLVTRGKTRKTKVGDRSGRIVLDAHRDGGAARFEPA
jgi:DNA topoisomerase III